MEHLINLGIALAIGLLIGVERGWQERSAEEGSRVAGVRTFGLLGLLGGLWSMLAETMGEILLGFSFLALTIVLIAAHLSDRRIDRDYGITTLIAGLVTFALGAIAVRGQVVVAAAGAVATAVLLSLKPTLHGWLRRLEPEVFYAALKLLLISVVVLPVLPNQEMGPWGALNPYHVWWLVVLIASLSFAGYIAMKVAGTERGILLTGILGGMVSSTAVTLTFARLAKHLTQRRLLAAAALLAAAIMFPRVLVEVAIVNPALLPRLLLPLGLMTAVAIAYAAWLWHRGKGMPDTGDLPLRNPLELGSALQFGLLLTAILLLSEAARAWLGDAGIYLVAVASGIADVDAITLALARMSQGSLAGDVAARGILLASMTNTLAKGCLVIAIAGGKMARAYAPGLILVLATGGGSLLLI